MKDYALNKKDKRMFILNYKIIDNQIIVNLASKEEFVIPYTEDNERKILDIMEKQVENSDKLVSKQEKRLRFNFILAMLCCPGFAYNCTTIFSTPADPVAYAVALGLGVGCAAGTIASYYGMIDSYIKRSDYEKNRTFLDNKGLLNKRVRSNANILSNTTKRTQKLVSSTPEDKPVFDINNIDKISGKDISTILNNIKRDNNFAFDYSPNDTEEVLEVGETTENKPKARVRKK